MVKPWKSRLSFVGTCAVVVLCACSPLAPDGMRETARAYVGTRSADATLSGSRIEQGSVVMGSEKVGWVVDETHGANDAQVGGGQLKSPLSLTQDDDGMVCYYLVVYWVDTGKIISVTLLGCRDEGGGGGSSCDEEQRKIAAEYDNPLYPVQRVPHPDCHDIELNGSGTRNFSWAELNGYFQGGNPHQGYGWVQQRMKTGVEALRRAWINSQLRIQKRYRPGLALSSGYRCPHGNTMEGGEATSYHMEGRAVDVPTRRIAGISVYWSAMTRAQQVEIRDLYTELSILASGVTGIDLQRFEKYHDDRHSHVAW